VFSSGEDKELEGLLLKQGIYINYLDDVPVYDEKTPKDEIFYNQRRRWIASQYNALINSIADFPGAVFSKNIDYADKIFQWMMLPRVILLGIICIISALLTIIDWELSLKWWGILFLLGLSFCMAIPDYLVDKRLTKAIIKIPWLFILMFLNLFRIKGADKKFIHTEHGAD
jgi:cellulose synthase/poly-beta-1,6-N-acetylglucosamine synthase-like glycosyltransferase